MCICVNLRPIKKMSVWGLLAQLNFSKKNSVASLTGVANYFLIWSVPALLNAGGSVAPNFNQNIDALVFSIRNHKYNLQLRFER